MGVCLPCGEHRSVLFQLGQRSTPRECDENAVSDYGWFGSNAGGMTHAVGGKRPSAWDFTICMVTCGSGARTVRDKDYYVKSPVNDPGGPPVGLNRVGRGGGFLYPASICRSASRNDLGPDGRRYDLGLRVSLLLADTAAERAKMRRANNATRPSDGSAANKSSPATATSDSQAAPALPVVSSFVGADGNWKLPAGTPSPAVAPFDAKEAKEHQEAWAKHLGVPVELTNSIGMKLVLIPPGEFQMGVAEGTDRRGTEGAERSSWYKEHVPSEGPQHRVRITTPFYMASYPVTQEEYFQIVGTSPSCFSASGGNKEKVAGQDTKRFPMENVSWYAAKMFL